VACRADADGDLHRVNHVVVVMMENHSFDNYLGALPYAPGTPYHPAQGTTGCDGSDHLCVDGLTCAGSGAGGLTCSTSNPDNDGSTVVAFHETRRCVSPDLDHGWEGTHREVNFANPNNTLRAPLMDGFVRVNDQSEQPDTGGESPTEDQTMGFYTQAELPFYYDLAQRFAIDDRYFASVLGPTFPNRAYLLAATSFGHLTTSDIVPPAGGYQPVNGTIFDLLDRRGVSWADYFSDVPQGGSFRSFGLTGSDPHFLPLQVFLSQAAGSAQAGPLPSVAFVDPNFGALDQRQENDEHPPTDIQRGQAFVSEVLNAIRNGPFWKDTVVFITYDEHGGSFDHVPPPAADQGGARTPDGVSPGQCVDLSSPPASETPGGGAQCSSNPSSMTDTSLGNAVALCPQLAGNPAGLYPESCPSFDQLGLRVPFIAVSPFSKPHYVSHTVGDHTSLLAFIEKRFLTGGTSSTNLTVRDGRASTLEDLFDFAGSPSLDAPVGQAVLPAQDCTP
jgi:phospholipase C